ncbi:DUF4382 domain-containing protein [Pedobacter cryophilus]|uniref:DUF4382 domain-containing protein n=1 Tax=Pedobacter cryophilus TaxID=2571271 RepID=A0A4U1BXQ5_9SPHI|nr:DUF4382 domain-containing protein [Pedobacter cryophilus]TKB97525.1 DUF4382 domain-containing protein [Pedobacter cryophilus]
MKKIILFSLLAISIGFTACEKSKSGTTQMNVKITDAPGDYDAIILNIKEINVITSEGSSILDVEAKPFDILKFRNGRDTLIASQNISSGTLKEVRLVLEATGNKIVVDGITYDLTTPSGQTSGVKLKVQEDLLDGVAYTLILDFDAAKSIVQTGNGKYILKPVIRAIPNAVSGAIVGTVSPLLSAPKIYAINGLDTVGTIIDATGKFYFNGMATGSYKINFETSAPYINKTLTDVNVTTGTVTNVGTVNLAN